MLDARFLKNKKWSDWEPIKLEFALRIASIYGNRSADELFVDLAEGTEGTVLYYTGGSENCDAIAIVMGRCPCGAAVSDCSFNEDGLE